MPQIIALETGQNVLNVVARKEYLILCLEDGVLRVINRATMLNVDFTFKNSPVMCADYRDDFLYVGTGDGLFIIDLVTQQQRQLFEELTWVCNVQILDRSRAIVTTVSRAPKYPVLPPTSEYQYRDATHGYNYYFLDLHHKKVLDRIQNLCSGGISCFNVQTSQLLIPLQPNVEGDVFVVYSLNQKKMKFQLEQRRQPPRQIDMVPDGCAIDENCIAVHFSGFSLVLQGGVMRETSERYYLADQKLFQVLNTSVGRIRLPRGFVQSIMIAPSAQEQEDDHGTREIVVGAEFSLMDASMGGIICANGQDAVWITF